MVQPLCRTRVSWLARRIAACVATAVTHTRVPHNNAVGPTCRRADDWDEIVYRPGGDDDDDDDDVLGSGSDTGSQESPFSSDVSDGNGAQREAGGGSGTAASRQNLTDGNGAVHRPPSPAHRGVEGAPGSVDADVGMLALTSAGVGSGPSVGVGVGVARGKRLHLGTPRLCRCTSHLSLPCVCCLLVWVGVGHRRVQGDLRRRTRQL